jgi:hypothetical protein
MALLMMPNLYILTQEIEKQHEMVTIIKKKFLLPVKQKWYSDKITTLDCLTITIYKQVDIRFKPLFFIKEKSYTLHSELTIHEEEITRKYNSTIQNEIRRAEKEGCSFIYNTTKEIFLKEYNNFATKRGLFPQSLDSLNAYRDNLIITSSSINNSITAIHSYLIDNDLKKVRLLHSASLRYSEGIDKNMIARSNKYLHYMDMKEFKKNGFETYDWGGIAYQSVDENLKGINKFKESFGGSIVEQQNLYSPLYYLLLKLFR